MKGLGILEVGVAQMLAATGGVAADLVAWLGPCIGPSRFQVGADVLAGFGVVAVLWGRQVRRRRRS